MVGIPFLSMNMLMRRLLMAMSLILPHGRTMSTNPTAGFGYVLRVPFHQTGRVYMHAQNMLCRKSPYRVIIQLCLPILQL